MEEGDVTEEDEGNEDGIRFVTLESQFESKETVLKWQTINLPCLLCKKMVKSAVLFGKIFNLMIYKTTCVALLCCKSHTHAANIKFQSNACSSCFKPYFPFLLPKPNPLLNLLPVLIILLNPLPVLVALKILQEIPCYTLDCFKTSCLLFVDTLA